MTDPLYRDAAASTADRVADLLGRMTLDEKIAQLGAAWITGLVDDGGFSADRAATSIEHGIGQVTRIGASTGLLPDQSATLMNDIQRWVLDQTRLGVPVVVHEESTGGFLARGATVFPQGLGLAAGFDPELIERCAGVIREQMLAVGARHTLAPVLDVARDPRWGRVEETYGESPELCARIGVGYVRGLQTDDLRDGVVCTGKHFLGYGLSQGGRNQAPVHLGPREVREVYAEPFAAAIREAGLASIMNSYSSIDGLPAAGSREVLTELLRDELGFDGVVVADYFAVMQLQLNHRTAADKAEAAAQALSAGLDVELPSLDYYPHLSDAIGRGLLDEAVIDTACERVLAQKIQLGLFERPFVEADRAIDVYETPAQRELAREAAVNSICLLHNEGYLPLDPASLSRVAVIGPHADDPRLLQGDYHYPTHLEIIYLREGLDAATEAAGTGTDMLPESGGSFAPGPYYTDHVTPLAGLQAALGDAVDIVHARGCSDTDPDDHDIDAAVDVAAAADVAIVCVGARSGLVPSATVGEARDAVSLDLPGRQLDLVEAVAATGTATVVVVISGRVHTLSEVVDAADAALWAILPGEEAGNALAQVLIGARDPGGRLPVTLPRHVGQLPLHHDMRARGDRSEFYGDYVDSPTSPLFAFGHGLGYSTFTIEAGPATAGTTTSPTEVSATITNTGDRAGTAVVQLYGRDDVASVARPDRELLGFTRIDLGAGEARAVTFTVDPTRLAFHGPDMALATEPGTHTFWIGLSSVDTPVESSVELTGERAIITRPQIVATAVTVA
ncbi:MAG: glycoside hydrolase family 3 C-terminal domain-containing protein [Acidimicrobiia bacterium]|nr:glycoside hydrolase family 3 C-terminal domain-containing protein [Acidimicrobiia bacterium]